MINGPFLGVADPNSILISGARVCKLWSETHPGIGTIGTVNPEISADLTTHNKSAVTSVTGDATAYTILSDDSSGAHYISVTPPASLIAAPCSITFKIRAGVDLLGLWPTLNAGSAGAYCYLDGTSSMGSGWTLVSTSTDGTWRTFTVRGPATNAANSIRLYLVKTAAANTYDGDGDETIIVKDVVIYQTRAASHNNLARNTDNTLVDATGGVQTTIANQELILDQNGNFYTGASGQIPVIAREAGRVAYLIWTDADVVGAATGNVPDMACCGIFKGTLDRACPLYWYGTGTGNDMPFRVYSGAIQAFYQDDAGVNQALPFAGTDGTEFTNYKTWATIRVGRVVELWIGGVYKGSVTFTTPGVATMANLKDCRLSSISGGQSWLMVGVFAGTMPGATPVVRYSPIQNVLRAACARYSPYVGALVA
jgi:hypothetical protein